MQGLQRRLAVRITRGYRTTSAEAALVVSGSIPWDLLTEAYAAMYEWRTILRQCGVTPAPRAKEAARTQFQQLALEKWKERLAHARVGLRAVGTIRPVLEDWVDRRPKGHPFRTVQVLTGHGCFGEYLHEKARREPTTQCHHCTEVRDTAQHTLADCPAWDMQRRVLTSIVGDDLSLPAIVSKMVESENAWDAMVSFCEQVMSQKETAERAREEDPSSDPIRRRRGASGGGLLPANFRNAPSRNTIDPCTSSRGGPREINHLSPSARGRGGLLCAGRAQKFLPRMQ